MFLYSKQTQYAYVILFLAWLIISLHVGYGYISFSSEQQQGKGGTFVEATTQDINYLPYVTNNDADKFYQSFLFNGCLYPTFSGTNIGYREELCNVETTDYKSFTIHAIDGKYRSDGTPFTLNDIYFTYTTLLKDNYWNIGALDSFNNLSIIADEEHEQLQVIFPKASIDNMIFFTNFILPTHLLANQSLETYITTFYQAPIGTNCSTLTTNKHDEDSVVFDLSLCTDVPLKFYQIKQFKSEELLQNYLENGGKANIDLIVSDKNYTGFTANKVILNKFVSIFFNTQRPQLPPLLRQQLASFIQTYIYQDTNFKKTIVKDHYLFDAFKEHNMTGFVSNLEKTIKGKTDTKDTTTVLPELPQILRREIGDTTPQEYVLPSTIEDKKILKFIFDGTYEKISVSFNEGVEYFPESYNATDGSSYYNLNPTYRNIIKGRNVYTIRAYTDNLHIDTYSFIVYYLSEPKYPQEESINNDTNHIQPLQIIYFASPTTIRLADALKTLFERTDLSDYITFTAFDDANIFAGKIQSQDYDIVLSAITMGLRKDMSNFFATENPSINPSLYTNEDMALATNEYFLFDPEARSSIKERIAKIYQQDMPFLILGKEMGTINIAESLSFPYPLRMYVLGWRKDFIKNLPVFQHFSIHRDRFRNYKNLNAFLTNRSYTEK